ncbi:folate family ECF transporter S component [Lactococcus allomyrinae]|uniref:Folate family ECF transporter S component n=1 Tax=Lactococcus allomyrinae TaxID=2419773 RepID=A0A387B8Q2_9LACT|nr:folate family ECF transporter S component [Lactococcus allomyrinae]AYG00195.1 folate family ECF transporter S component [Lactococcus allomyrinae]
MKNFTKKIELQRLVLLAFLLALQLVLSRLAIGNSFFRLSPVFIANALIGMIAGPLWGGILLMIGDILGAVLSGVPYFPGFTISAFFVGILYGIFFYKKRLDIKNKKHWFFVFIAIAIIMLIDSTFFNTLWITLMIPNSNFSTFMTLLSGRVLLLLQVPLETCILMFIIPTLQSIKPIGAFITEHSK